MKNVLIVTIIFATTLFISCKKDPMDIPIGTIKTNIGSEEKTFSINAKATRLNVTNGHGIQVEGYYRTGSTTNLVLTIVSPSPITSNTYAENPGSNPLVTMTHCVEFFSPCVLRTSAYGSVTNPVSITITEITGTYIRGTFKGELAGPVTNGTQTKEVFANGVFFVSF